MRVMVVNEEGMLVSQRVMPVQVGVRLWPLPARMVMVVVLVVDVEVLMLHCLMGMLQSYARFRWPKA